MTEIRVNTTVTIGTLSVEINIEDTIPDPDQFIEPEQEEVSGLFMEYVDPYTAYRNSAVAALTGRSALAARTAATEGQGL